MEFQRFSCEFGQFHKYRKVPSVSKPKLIKQCQEGLLVYYGENSKDEVELLNPAPEVFAVIKVTVVIRSAAVCFLSK